MNTIKTTYKPTKNSEVLTQHWHAYLPEHFSPSSERYPENLKHAFQQWVDRVKALTIANIEIYPVITDTVTEGWNLKICSGYEGNPGIVVRGLTLPLFTAKPQYFHTEKQYRIFFSARNYNAVLTSGQRDKLDEWFSEQLLTAVQAPELLESLKARCLANAHNTVTEFIADTRKRLDDLETLANELTASK